MLRLLARGLSNPQIAERLVISRRTAEHHVQHIYTKIGHSTRAAAALFAMEHDLLRLADELPDDRCHHGRVRAVRDVGVPVSTRTRAPGIAARAAAVACLMSGGLSEPDSSSVGAVMRSIGLPAYVHSCSARASRATVGAVATRPAHSGSARRCLDLLVGELQQVAQHHDDRRLVVAVGHQSAPPGRSSRWGRGAPGSARRAPGG